MTKQATHYNRFRWLAVFIILWGGLVVILGFRNSNQRQESDYSLHSKYIYHFTKYFEWPQDRQNGPFVIGIFSNHDLYLSLKNIAEKKKINSRNLLVMEFNPDDDPQNCHMLFLGRPALRFIDKITLKTADKPIILLSDKLGYTRKGADINFIIKDEQLRFELASGSIESKRIKIANELKALALPAQ